MDVQALTTLVGFAVFALAMLTYLATMKRDLTAVIDGLRTELRGEISELRAETRDGFARIDNRLTVLEQRTYDLAGRPPTAS